MILGEVKLTEIFGPPGTDQVTVIIPILGKVTCHRKIWGQLEMALAELEHKGFSHLIDLAQWKAGGGCYVKRYMRGKEKRKVWSHHSWGIAIDLNHQSFPRGSTKKQDRQLVEILKKWGFVNGEIFKTPDPMHFEWVKFVNSIHVLGGEDELDAEARRDIKTIGDHLRDWVEPRIKDAHYRIGKDEEALARVEKAILNLTEAIGNLASIHDGTNHFIRDDISDIIKKVKENIAKDLSD